jgi:hypothetical protein
MSTRPIVRAAWLLTAFATQALAAAPDTPVEQPGDAALSCEEIATELAPYAQQIVPSIQAFGASGAQLMQQSRRLGEQQKAEAEALLPLALAGAVDTTGASKRAYQAALMAQQAKQKAESDALANSPLAKQNKAQGEQMATQATALQSNARLQRLMQLAQEKRCDKR